MSDKNKKIDDSLDKLLGDLEEDNSKLEEVAAEVSADSDVDEKKIEALKATLMATQENLGKAMSLLEAKSKGSTKEINISTDKDTMFEVGAQRIIEGVFNGESMVGGDGKRYNVPANYASKSKLIEGDILKLTITREGSFIFKQIGPIERKQLMATLGYDDTDGDWYAVKDGKRWRLLTASVTYFKGEPGDEVVIIIPKSSQSNWASVENVIKT